MKDLPIPRLLTDSVPLYISMSLVVCRGFVWLVARMRRDVLLDECYANVVIVIVEVVVGGRLQGLAMRNEPLCVKARTCRLYGVVHPR
jgi:hypothetical protein